jgi:exodeoxyribonuclease VII large subunit
LWSALPGSAPAEAEAETLPGQSAISPQATGSGIEADAPGATSSPTPQEKAGLRIFEVSEVMRHARGLLESDPLLADVWIHGEISSLSPPSANGHVYFCLREGNSQLNCVLFRKEARRLRTPLEHGQSVIAHGCGTLYEPRSTFQLIADLVEPEGVGLAQLQFDLLRQRLEEEGLFAEERKRPLPAFPRCIGVATSANGAVIHDIVRVLSRRYPLAEVVVAHCAVQGDSAPREIVAAIARLNEYAAPRLRDGEDESAIDVLIVARGGGAPEELGVFNDEAVARAIFASAIPVISAIGHETDYTIADFVADLRAATPSVAAELVAPDLMALQADVLDARRRLAASMIGQVQDQRQQVTSAQQRLVWHSPQASVARRRQEADDLAQRLRAAIEQAVATRLHRLEGRKLQLQALSPSMTLARGYALCYDTASGAVVTAADQVAPGALVDVRLHRGVLRSEVQATADLAIADGEARVAAAADGAASGG